MIAMHPLDTWLQEHNARNIRHEELRNGDALDWIAAGGRVLLLQTYAKGNGWDIFMPPTDDNRIDSTLAALDQRLKEPNQ